MWDFHTKVIKGDHEIPQDFRLDFLIYTLSLLKLLFTNGLHPNNCTNVSQPSNRAAQGSLLQTMVLRMLQGTKWVLGKQGHAHDFDPAQVKAMNVIDGSSLWHFAASRFVCDEKLRPISCFCHLVFPNCNSAPPPQSDVT